MFLIESFVEKLKIVRDGNFLNLGLAALVSKNKPFKRMFGMWLFLLSYLKCYFLAWCLVMAVKKKFFAINYWLFRTGYIRRLGNTAIISFFAQLLFCAKQRDKRFCEGALFSGVNIFTASPYFKGWWIRYIFFIINFNKKNILKMKCNI